VRDDLNGDTPSVHGRRRADSNKPVNHKAQAPKYIARKPVYIGHGISFRLAFCHARRALGRAHGTAKGNSNNIYQESQTRTSPRHLRIGEMELLQAPGRDRRTWGKMRDKYRLGIIENLRGET